MVQPKRERLRQISDQGLEEIFKEQEQVVDHGVPVISERIRPQNGLVSSI